MPVTINGTTGIAGPDGSASTPAVQGTDSNTGLFFPAADTVGVATGGAEAARINSSGTLILKGGSTSATGVGITFPADTTTTVSSNANTLDDYEEGTWTPTFSGATNLTGTPAAENFVYTKIGRVVSVSGRVTGYSVTSSSTVTGFTITVPINMALSTGNFTGSAFLYTSRSPGGVVDNTGGNANEIYIEFKSTLVTSTGSSTIDFSLVYNAAT